MKSLELEAKNLDEIRAQAAAKLGVSEDEIDLEVLEEKRPLLGLIGGTVVARATVREVEEAPAPEPTEAAPEQPAEEDPSPEREGAEDAPPTEGDDMARLANRAELVANEMLQLMGVSVQAQAAEIGDEEVTLDLTGEDIALVIGKHGDTLDALQLLTAIIANRASDTGARVVLDAEDYRGRRERALEATALSHAAKAKETDREVVIRDLKAYERRIIHITLRDDPQAETYSEGEGRQRNLVISPVPVDRGRDTADEDEE